MNIKEFKEMVSPYLGKKIQVGYALDNEEGLYVVEMLCQYKGSIQMAGCTGRIGEIGYERKVQIKDKYLQDLEHLMDVIDAYGWGNFELCVETEPVNGIAVIENKWVNRMVLTTEKHPLTRMDTHPYYCTPEEAEQTVTWLCGDYL